MENEKLQIVMGQHQKAEVILREVNETNELEVREPLQTHIVGTIETPFRFLEKRWNTEDAQIDHNRTTVLVDRDNLMISLITNETDERKKQVLIGKIELSKEFKNFHINEDFDWTPESLAQFCRLYRSYFPDKTQNMTLVSLLKNFKAKISTDIERDRKDNGSYTDNYAKIVNSNVPTAFKIKIPLFKGSAKQELEVETIATIDGRDITLQLLAVGAIDAIEQIRDEMIDAELNKIREFAPEIPIIEQ